MQKLRISLLTGTLVAALSTSVVFAGPQQQQQDPIVQKDGYTTNINTENTKNNIKENTQNQLPSPHAIETKILAELTNRDEKDIQKQALEKGQTLNEIAQEAGVYEQFITQKYELAKANLDQAVANGKITQEQAEQILNNIKDGKENPTQNIDPRFASAEMRQHQQSAQILAQLTNRTPQSILEEAQEKQISINEIAQTEGVYDQFIAQKYELAKATLDQAVTEGKITQEQAEQILKDIKDGKEPIIVQDENK
ncbi:MAG TPA: hypothetical protein IAB06_08020 [Candidatus Avacidaminococcus intestinavium]|uniref:LysM domain-containing protein n=1 Tax=Candidatus Avacidaminococcus intestinavium TaxID=2840684 RepID=A0A9D1MR52_9FIRM|nr:hypothetical protein [Candidatus Avacidaminococcus intestinavium]